MSKYYMPENVEKVLPYAGDFESAHIALDYPYGRLQCEMRFWCEYKKGKGFRAVTRSKNPKTGEWNKPHADTYVEALACYIEAGTGHIKFAEYRYDFIDAELFLNTFEKGLHIEGKKPIKYNIIRSAVVEKLKGTPDYTLFKIREMAWAEFGEWLKTAS